MFKCPKCGFCEENTENRFCSECGYDFQENNHSLSEKKCPKCGYIEQEINANYCSECGYNLSEPSFAFRLFKMFILIIAGYSIIMGGIYAIQNYDWAYNTANYFGLKEIFPNIVTKKLPAGQVDTIFNSETSYKEKLYATYGISAKNFDNILVVILGLVIMGLFYLYNNHSYVNVSEIKSLKDFYMKIKKILVLKSNLSNKKETLFKIIAWIVGIVIVYHTWPLLIKIIFMLLILACFVLAYNKMCIYANDQKTGKINVKNWYLLKILEIFEKMQLMFGKIIISWSGSGDNKKDKIKKIGIAIFILITLYYFWSLLLKLILIISILAFSIFIYKKIYIYAKSRNKEQCLSEKKSDGTEQTSDELQENKDIDKKNNIVDTNKLFGAIAIKLNLVDKIDVEESLKLQQEDIEHGIKKHIGAYLYENEKISKEQIKMILEVQKKYLEKNFKNDNTKMAIGIENDNSTIISSHSTLLSMKNIDWIKRFNSIFEKFHLNNINNLLKLFSKNILIRVVSIIVVLFLVFGVSLYIYKNFNFFISSTTASPKLLSAVESYIWKYEPKDNLWLLTTNISFYNMGDSDITELEVKVQYVRFSNIFCEETFKLYDIPSHKSKSIFFKGNYGYRGDTLPEGAKAWAVDVFKKIENKWVEELYYKPESFIMD